METITSIEQQAKDKNRVNVYINGRFYCGLKLEVAIKYHLKAGMEIEKGKLDEVQLETEKSQALDKALSYLSATMKTKKQICDYLEKKGYTQAVINYVLEKLVYHNLLDDYAYCRAYVNSVTGKGKKALYSDLVKRGAEEEAIRQILDETDEDTNSAVEVLQKYFRGKTVDKNALYKGVKYLMSKGFSYDTAKDAAEKFGDTDEDY
jgi:regulatory protein